ncbi:hypothetical protein SAMD00019534_002430 [Acytostelium subglobosum LB1]|uniref:hypothetical protein n=1 Tax=Acytostelium subglobosum LB1 TaxID=1410327 RepID=UPI000644B209|nr:hypothetical protein SAMD00019534_002430 [Acytostelium subglobosum LB1]GAM17068.1 hypothetical protein SAMD00019534_002430 [Acytostelium subglobosum LB1]|eukprot:XP_012759130.1 hypothetical protein SAMD00019534_002430 [Acytostelium subglobosum LB1]
MNEEELDHLYNTLILQLNEGDLAELFNLHDPVERQIAETIKEDRGNASLKSSLTSSVGRATSPEMMSMKTPAAPAASPPIAATTSPLPSPPLYTPEDMNAADRLLASWIRTGLSLMTFGIGVGSKMVTSQNSITFVTSLVFFGTGIVCVLWGLLKNYYVTYYLLRGYYLPSTLSIFIILLLSLLVTGVSYWAVVTDFDGGPIIPIPT